MSPRHEVRPECRTDIGMHQLCRPGPVKTSFGDVALTVRCDCPCHKTKKERRPHGS
ncbi:hypothetical protein [Streptomyces sp. NPDC056543]|uniref:hypothetical protein n=1 Tax=unclassified Streptomyces TaxID=2593676 RepID=UPI0036C55B80